MTGEPGELSSLGAFDATISVAGLVGLEMLSFIKKFFADPTADWPRAVDDSVLGELRLSDDADWWEGQTTVGNRVIDFKIGGEGKPDEKLIFHAHNIVQSLSEFEQLVSDFLAKEVGCSSIFTTGYY